MGIFGTPLGWIMRFIYDFIHNYGLTLIVFTVLVRLLMYPLSVKQQKSTAKMQIFQPKIQKLQKQFAKDKKRLQEETMKLYEEEGYNPMGSCLPTIIQFILLFGIIDVVYKPLKHLLGVSSDAISQATDLLKEAGYKATSMAELDIMNIIQGNSKDYSADMFNDVFSSSVIEKIQNFDFTFLGLNLGQTPEWGLNVTIIIPLLSGITSLLISVMTIMNQKKNGMGQQAGGGFMKGMMIIMPIFSTWIAFSFPLGLGLYWTVGNICMLVTNLILYTVYSPEKMKAQVEAEIAEKKKNKKKSTYAKMMEMSEKQNSSSEKKENSKESVNNGMDEMTASQKIALARKRMAEKYGDDYDEEEK
jgi:YidC/Oxa1 family membrane protein insertase